MFRIAEKFQTAVLSDEMNIFHVCYNASISEEASKFTLCERKKIIALQYAVFVLENLLYELN